VGFGPPANRRRIDRAARAERAGRRLRRALWAGAAAALLVLGLVGFRAAWREATRGDAFRIRSIRFEGLHHARERELLRLSPLKVGDNLFTADVDGMAEALERHPWVGAAEVRRRWPPALEVTVRERKAVALVELAGLYLVDADAQLFKRAAPGDGLDLPVITGFTRDDYVRRQSEVEPLLADALAILRAWQEAGLARALPVSEVHLSALDGATVYAGEEGLQVKLGSGEIAPKLERLKTVLAALGADGKRASVIHLDSRAHPSWVTVRPEGGGGSLVAGRTDPRGP
jgi:cell division protein FtsQ